jgi:hypothetical protein
MGRHFAMSSEAGGPRTGGCGQDFGAPIAGEFAQGLALQLLFKIGVHLISS